MSLEIILLFAIIAGALYFFVSGVVPVDLTAILVMVALMVTGILSPEEGVSGFSNSATVTILALLFISEGLKNTGAVEALGDQLLMFSGKQEWVTILMVMVISAVISAFINNTAVVAVFIPVMFKISKSTGIRVSSLLIPLSFASMVGGASTMIGTSTNLLINSLAEENGIESFSLFQPVALGALLLIVVILYMIGPGKWILSKKEKQVQVFNKKSDAKNYITEIEIPEGSQVNGKTLNDLSFFKNKKTKVLQLNKDDSREVKEPDSRTMIKTGDRLIIKANVEEIVKLSANPDIRIITRHESKQAEKNYNEDELFEVLITDNSDLLEQRIKDVDFNSYYDAYPIAVKKKRLRDADQLKNHKVGNGDILLMQGNSHQGDIKARNAWVLIQRFSHDEIKSKLPRENRMWVSVLITLLVIALAVLNILPILISAWLGVGIMILTDCITLKKAYDNISWNVIFLLAGIIPLGIAMNKTGADQLIANGIFILAQGAPTQVLIGSFFIFTVVLTGIISNQATAVLLVPIAFKLSQQLPIGPEPLLMTILFGASTSFLTPVGYQTNAMILGPGNYKFMDFVKVGGLLCLIFGIITAFLIPIFY